MSGRVGRCGRDAHADRLQGEGSALTTRTRGRVADGALKPLPLGNAKREALPYTCQVGGSAGAGAARLARLSARLMRDSGWHAQGAPQWRGRRRGALRHPQQHRPLARHATLADGLASAHRRARSQPQAWLPPAGGAEGGAGGEGAREGRERQLLGTAVGEILLMEVGRVTCKGPA